jgi:hypothetical protein
MRGRKKGSRSDRDWKTKLHVSKKRIGSNTGIVKEAFGNSG